MNATCTSCGEAVAGSDVLYSTQAQIVCPRCFAQADLAMTLNRVNRGPIYAGLVIGAIPFVAHLGWSNYASVNGVASGSSRDLVALACGAIALVFGVVALVSAFGYGPPRKPAAAVLVIALGGFQLVRGFGVFDDVPLARSEFAAAADPPAPELPAGRPLGRPAAPEPCAEKDPCFEFGERAANAGDTKAALAAYRRACELGSPGGCGKAADLVPEADAVALYERGCDLGGPIPCANLGAVLIKGTLVVKDFARARRVLATSCDGNEGLGCRNLAVLYQDGLGTKVDLPKVAELLGKACELGEAPACDALGAKLYRGIGVNRNPRRAAALFARSCELADAECFDHGVALEDGIGGPKHLNEARVAYDKACSASQYTACFNLALMLEGGRGGAKDPGAAKQLFQKACDGGFTRGCRK